MKFNKWTLGLAAIGVVSLASVVQAEEKSNPVMTALSSTSISGYVDTSAVWRMGNNTSGGVPGFAMGPNSFNPTTPGLLGNKADGFNLNVVGLTLEKPLDEAEWAAGYKADLLFGPDAAGWNPSSGAFASPFSDFSLKQAYVQLRAPVGNGLDFKLGTWDTPLGYESFESYKNVNYSRSYGWAIEPTQHTGLLANYKVNDVIGLCAGIANTVTTGINARAVDRATGVASESEKTYMAGVTLTAPESLGFLAGSTLHACVINGLGVGFTDTTWMYAGATLNTPVEGLKVGVAYDERMNAAQIEGANPAFGGSSYAYSLAGYLSYQATEKLKFAGRYEFAKGTAGTWYAAGPGEIDPKNAIQAITATVDYSLWENVITRLEFRWDRDLTDQHLSASGPGPWGHDDNNNYYMALNVIYKF